MRVYVASALGFAVPTRGFSAEVLLPRLRTGGIEPLDPWAGGEAIVTALAVVDQSARIEALRQANEAVAARNVELIESADALLAVLDGPDVDSGTASEIGYAAALGIPVVGWRSDLRSAGDNEGSVVNLQVEHFVRRAGGAVVTTLEAAVAALVALPMRRA